MMSYCTVWKAFTACEKLEKIWRTDVVSDLPFVPPISVCSSLLNCSTVWQRSRMSWQRSRKESSRAKRAEFWKRQGFSGVSCCVRAL